MSKNEQVQFVVNAMESLPDSRVEAIYQAASIQVSFESLERSMDKCRAILADCVEAVQS